MWDSLTCFRGEDVARHGAFPRADRCWVPTGVAEYVIQELCSTLGFALSLAQRAGLSRSTAFVGSPKAADRPCNLLSLSCGSRTIITFCLCFCAQLSLWLECIIGWDELESCLWDSEERVSPVHGLLTLQHTGTELLPCWRRLLISK